ncbi:MAG TPA: urea ABC transporter ATP-binding subunit UrtE [Acidiferrobacter sp.]|nr:urea ABC transporter ATP-binding subunit UrtE [Acidiferrobacter sp.]
MPEPILTLTGVASGYGDVEILHGVDLVVPEASIVCVLGRNGVGKTTLLKTLMGRLPTKAGRIVLAGVDMTKEPTHKRACAGLGYVPQGREVFPFMTVEENIRLATLSCPGGTSVLPEKIFDYFPGLTSMLRRKAGVLSGGQQQQLALARALASRPKLLVLDEPTEGIQPNIAAEIEEIVMRLHRDEHMAVLLVEQKIGFARRVATHYSILEKGIVASAGPIALLEDGLVRRYLEVA